MAAKRRYDIPRMKELEEGPRKLLVDAIKKVLSRLQSRGWVEKDKTYKDILGEPRELYKFIEGFRNNKSIAQDLLVDLKGDPVEDEKTELRCGINLEQICQMLVFTAARRQMPGKKNEAKLVALSPYLAFSWQLPLLQSYNFLLSTEHVDVLGEEILDLRKREDVEIVASYRVEEIARARMITEGRFVEMIQASPQAIKGVNLCQPKEYKEIEEILGGRIWRFFSRDEHYIKMVMDIDDKLKRAFGPALADLIEEAFHRIRRMPVERSVVLIQALRNKYEEDAEVILAEPEFLNTIFKNMVEYLYLLECDDDLFKETVRIKLNALDEDIKEWIDKAKKF